MLANITTPLIIIRYAAYGLLTLFTVLKSKQFMLVSWFGKMRVPSSPVMISMIQSCMLVSFYCTVGVATRMIDA
jgi:uncharacterized protein (DUF486 family)